MQETTGTGSREKKSPVSDSTFLVQYLPVLATLVKTSKPEIGLKLITSYSVLHPNSSKLTRANPNSLHKNN